MAIEILPAVTKKVRRTRCFQQVKAAEHDVALDVATCMALGTIFYKQEGVPLQDWQLLGPGWALIDQVSPEDGFDGLGLYHVASRSLVMVNRGAEGLRSITDWIQGAKAAFGNWDGPLLEGVDFLVACYDKAVAAGRNIQSVVCTGHSWGGALAEAQVAVGRPLLKIKGFTGDVWGLGFGSAGFADAITELAGHKGVAIHAAEVAASMTHFIRNRDLILRQPNHRLLGSRVTLASIYETGDGVKPDKNSAAPKIWTWSGGENHTSVYYFDFRDRRDDVHLYVRSDGTYAVVTGREPALTHNKKTPPAYSRP